MPLLEAASGIMQGLTTIAGWAGVGEKRQDRRQISQQTKLNEVNAKTSKELADYEQDLKMKMWKDTNYGGQLEEATKAGVSKAAVLGGSGTGTQGASVSGVSGTGAADAAATTNARTAQMAQGMQLASQLALQKAQKENIEADTANKLVTAENTALQTDTGKQTQEATIQTIKEKAFQQLAETGIAEQNRSVGAETIEARITKIKGEAIGQMLENANTESGTKVNEARVKEITNGIIQRWKGLELEGKGQEVSERNMERMTEAMLWGAGIQATGNLVKGIMDIATKGKGTITTRRETGDKFGKMSETITKPIK